MFVFFYLELNRRCPKRTEVGTFPQPHLVTVTDTRPTSKNFVINVIPKDITPWSGQDSNPRHSASDPDALTIIARFKNNAEWYSQVYKILGGLQFIFGW